MHVIKHITLKATNKYTNFPIQQLTMLINKEGGTKVVSVYRKSAVEWAQGRQRVLQAYRVLDDAHAKDPSELIFI